VEIDVTTTAPPDGTEFMDGDAFVYVRGNDVCLCATALHDTSVRQFLALFFSKASIRHDAGIFDLMKVADVNKIKFLHAQGVKEIELRSTLYEATRHYHDRKSQTRGIVGSVAKHVKAILGNEHDANEDAIRVVLTLVTDARRKGIIVGEKRIKTLALDLLKSPEKDDDFVIITKNGEKIGPKEIFLRSTVELDAQGKSVAKDKAWKELAKFYNTLAGTGALEQ
jgi:hypothetical protein